MSKVTWTPSGETFTSAADFAFPEEIATPGRRQTGNGATGVLTRSRRSSIYAAAAAANPPKGRRAILPPIESPPTSAALKKIGRRRSAIMPAAEIPEIPEVKRRSSRRASSVMPPPAKTAKRNPPPAKPAEKGLLAEIKENSPVLPVAAAKRAAKSAAKKGSLSQIKEDSPIINLKPVKATLKNKENSTSATVKATTKATTKSAKKSTSLKSNNKENSPLSKIAAGRINKKTSPNHLLSTPSNNCVVLLEKVTPVLEEAQSVEKAIEKMTPRDILQRLEKLPPGTPDKIAVLTDQLIREHSPAVDSSRRPRKANFLARKIVATPTGAANPSHLLRMNLKKQVQCKIEERVKNIPGSPYELKEEESSPVFFKKAEKEIHSLDYISGTPLRKRKVAVCRAPLMTQNTQKTKSPVVAANSPSPVKLGNAPELMTGDLGKLCLIM